MTTIHDVAREANVSIATVSHALNGTRPVAPATRDTILAVIDRMGYHRNALGRNLRRQRSQMIGVIVSDIANPFFSDIAKAIEVTARRRGYFTVICNTNEDVDQEKEYVHVLNQQLVDGFVVSPCVGHHDHLNAIVQDGRRLVIINRDVPVAAPTLVMDTATATQDLTTQLITFGCTRIGVVAGLEAASTTQKRLDGHRHALQTANLAYDPTLMRFTAGNVAEGYLAALDLLTTHQCDGLLVCNALLAEGALEALHATPLAARPALAGFDVPPWASLAALPFVCSAAQPVRELGEKSVTVLLDWIEKGVMPDTREQLAMLIGPVSRTRPV